MSRGYSSSARRQMQSVQGTDAPVWLLQLDHPDLASPVRVVQDNQDLDALGETWIAVGFRFVPPDEKSGGKPRGSIAVDNVNRALMPWLELSGGARGTTARMIHLRRSAPNTIEWETTMALTNIRATATQVQGDLSYDELLDMPLVAITYNLQTAPGLF